jgi:hemerythrin superfamily protein
MAVEHDALKYQVTLLLETSWNNLKTSSQQRLKDRYPQVYKTIHANSFVQSLFPQLNRYMTEDRLYQIIR